ncbi:hypothetical protein Sste5344_005442 [Sporothrix stenoceras]
MKDREDEAWQVIMKLHGLANDEPSPMATFAEEEFYQMKQQVAADLRTAASEIWRLFPETKGLSLEEIGEVFGDDVAVRLTQLTAEEREELDRNIYAKKAAEIRHVELSGCSHG